MRIGLVGAPGSGKTKFANALTKELDEYDLSIIDRYVPKFSKRYDFAVGHFASFIPNLSIALDRLGLENAAQDNFITCGTIFETMSYLLLHANEANKRSADGRLEVARASATMGAMGMLVTDGTFYDYLFYLPYKTERNDWDGALDKLIPQLVEEFFVYMVKLDLSFTKNIELAAGIIRDIEKEKSEAIETTSDDEPSVREGGEASSAEAQAE